MANVSSLRSLSAILLVATTVMSSATAVEKTSQSFAKQCLIQTKHEVRRLPQKNHVKANLHHADSHKKRTIHTDNEVLKTLPEPILALGRDLFKNEDTFVSVVKNSVEVKLTHAGVEMKVRINSADDALTRLGDEGKFFSYDLDTMGDLRESGSDLLNMLDIGGNYGVVSIAAFKKYPKSLRIATVEPIPTTFFFLKWNLFLNGVPEIDESASTWRPGVLALNRGTAATDGDDLHLCFDPKSSMNARMCECSRGDEHCTIVPSITINKLMSMFGKESIAMVKMDCEGCEFQALPTLAEPNNSERVRRLAGELHLPDQNLEALACHWDRGRLMTKCQYTESHDVACEVPLGCPM